MKPRTMTIICWLAALSIVTTLVIVMIVALLKPTPATAKAKHPPLYYGLDYKPVTFQEATAGLVEEILQTKPE